MRISPALLAFALAANAVAQVTPIIVPQPVPQATVLSPLTSPTAANNQALMNQITSTLQQRAFQHQVLTLQQPVVQPIVIQSPILVRPK